MTVLLAAARVLLAITVLLAGVLVTERLADGRLDTDVLALLPAEGDAVLQRANAAGRAEVLILLRGAPDAVVEARAQLQARLMATRDYDALDSVATLVAALAPLRYRALASADRAALARGDDAALLQAALERLAQPVPLVPLGQLGTPAQDPLFVFDRAASERLAVLAPPQAQQSAQDPFELLHLRLRGDALDLALQTRVEANLTSSIAAVQAATGVRIIATGVVRHAAANARLARDGAERVATLSSVLVVGLALWAFRALGPMLVTFLPVLAGTAVGYAAAFLVFPRLHVLTLVFGATLVGSASDYAFHYLCARSDRAPRDDRALAFRLAGPLAWSAGSAAVAYACMSVVGVTALAQIAIIGGVGLVTAAATILLWFPLLSSRLSLPRVRVPGWLRVLREQSARRGLAVTAAALLLAVALLLQFGHGRGDVRALDASPAALRADTAAVMAAASASDQGVFVLVRGADAARWRANEQAARRVLDGAIGRGDLAGYLAVSQLWPSAREQAADSAAIRRLLRDDGPAQRFVESVGAVDWLAAWRRGAAEDALHAPIELPPAALSAALPGLWLGADATGYASVVRLRGLRPDQRAREQLRTALPDGSQWVDVPSRLSHTFAALTRGAARALAAALVLVAVGLALWCRRPRGALALLPVGAAVGLALGCTAGLAGGLDVFRVLGGFLVLALATDFVVLTIAEDDERTVLGMLLGAVTTGGAFAALALLPIPAVQGFGMVVAIGTALALLLTTLARGWLSQLRMDSLA